MVARDDDQGVVRMRFVKIVSDGDGGQSRASALGNAGSGFQIGGCRGGAEERADGGRDGIGEKSSADLREASVLVEHIGFSADSDEHAERVEEIDEEECEHHDEEVDGTDEEPSGNVGALEGPCGDVERLSEEFSESVEGSEHGIDAQSRQHGVAAEFRFDLIESGELCDDSEPPGHEDADEDASAYLFLIQKGDDEHAGKNIIGAELASGFNNSESWGAFYNNIPSLMMQLEIEYTDGTSLVIGTIDETGI